MKIFCKKISVFAPSKVCAATTVENASRSRFCRRAFAAVFVLAIIFIASVLTLSIAEYATLELRSAASSRYESDLRVYAHSALNAAVAVLEEYRTIDGGLYSELQGWAKPLADKRIAFEGAEVEVKISDESGKIPLSALEEGSLVLLFEYLDFSTAQAQELADCLLDWTDADTAKRFNGAEFDDYDTYSAKPPNRALESLNELRFIQKFGELFFDKNGVPNEKFKRFAEMVSVEEFSKVNLNSASEAVLAALMALKDTDYDPNLFQAVRGKIGSLDKGISWVKNAGDIHTRGVTETPDEKFSTYTAELLKIEVWVRRGIAEYYICVHYGSASNVSGSASSAAKKSSQASRSNSAKSGKTQSSSSAKKASSNSTAKTKAQNSRSAQSASSNAKILKFIERGK